MSANTMRAAVALALLTFLVGMVGTAQAAGPRIADFRMFAGTQETKGNALAKGRLRIGPHRVFGRLSIDDLCPGDGYGAYLNVFVYFRNSTREFNQFVDREGCDRGGRKYSYDRSFPKRTVTSVKITVLEFDNRGSNPPAPGSGVGRQGDAQSRYFERKTTGR